MSFLNTNSFRDRQTAAAQARKAMAEKFLAKPKYDPSDPAVLEREAKRKEILEARVQREAERTQRKAEKEARSQEETRLEALRLAEEEAVRRAESERLEFEKKLERDARYAARKARKQKKKTVAERWGG